MALLGMLVRKRSLTASITAEYFVSIAGDVAFCIIPLITAIWLRPRWKSPARKAYRSLANAIVISPSHSFSPLTKWYATGAASCPLVNSTSESIVIPPSASTIDLLPRKLIFT